MTAMVTNILKITSILVLLCSALFVRIWCRPGRDASLRSGTHAL